MYTENKELDNTFLEYIQNFTDLREEAMGGDQANITIR